MRTGGGTTLVGGDQLVMVDACAVAGGVPQPGGAVVSGCIEDDGSVDPTPTLMTSKKGANMTERVPVPSSEHVAEIVGRQGCKIKALRNKTNTYIKTPVRGEEPVFVVTGRQQDVEAARREILSAAEHFTQIRASRRQHANKVPAGGPCTAARRRSPSPGRHRQARSSGPAPTATTTLGVRVPMSMVGLVVGPKGATIKRIQADTGTYIITPGRDRDPVFEVIGSADAVEKARQHIDAYIETRLTATDRREVSLLPSLAACADDVWPAADLDHISSGFDLVDRRDTIARLLALSTDFSQRPPQPPAWPLPQAPQMMSSWSNWGVGTDNDDIRVYDADPVPPTPAQCDPDDIISTLYARMLIAETSRAMQTAPPRDEHWPLDVGLSPGSHGGSSSDTASFDAGGLHSAGGGGVLNDIYYQDTVDNNVAWNAYHGFLDENLRATLGDDGDLMLSGGQWRQRPKVDTSAAVIGVGSCGSDEATSPSCSPAESSTGSAA